MKRLLLDNLGWKLLSLAIAVLLWFAVAGEPRYELPSQIRLRFERRLSREVPLHIRFSGSPPPGYSIKHLQVQPVTLRIAGPQSRVNRVEQAETDAIDLAGVMGEREFRVHVSVGDPQVRFDSVPEVSVKIVTERDQPREAP